MKGIAVSVYDKFDEVKILSDILKENWEEDYYLVVVCPHPDAEEEFSDTDIDELILGPDIDFSPDMEGHKHDLHLTSRIMESIKQGCTAAMDAGCDYVMHIHADAWPLDEERFNDIIRGMEERDRKVAVKGRMTLRQPKASMGGTGDQFFILDTEYFKEVGFFDFNPLDLRPYRMLRDTFMVLLLGRVGRSNIWVYFDGTEDRFWDGEKRNNWDETGEIGTMPHIRPSAYNPKWDLVHVNTDDFLDKDGKKLQARYLEEYGLTEGEFIEEFLEKYLISKEKLLNELDRKERKLNRGLKYVGVFNPEKYGYNRNFKHKEEVLDESISKKILRLFRNLSRFAYYKSHLLFFSLPLTSHIVPSEKQTFRRDLKRQNYYMDSEWPKRDKEIYSEAVDVDKFPDRYKQEWFKG